MVSSGTKRSAAFCTARCKAASSAVDAPEPDTLETPSPAPVIPSCPSRYGFYFCSLSSQACLSRRNRPLKGGEFGGRQAVLSQTLILRSREGGVSKDEANTRASWVRDGACALPHHEE